MAHHVGLLLKGGNVDFIDAASVHVNNALIDLFTASAIIYPYEPPRPATPWEAFLGSLDQAGRWVTSIAGGY